MTANQIRAMARRLEIKGISRLPRAALAGALRETLRGGEASAAAGAAGTLLAEEVAAPPRSVWSGSLPADRGKNAESAPRDVPQRLLEEQLSIVRTKFDPGIGRDLRIDPAAQLPETYGRNRIALLVRDPRWLFLYWEVTPDRFREARGGGFRRPVLRVQDVTDPGPEPPLPATFFDLPCNEEVRSWYLHIPAEDRAYQVLVGCLDDRGEFFQLLQSNVVRTPPGQVSPIIANRFARVPFNAPLRRRGAGEHGTVSCPFAAKQEMSGFGLRPGMPPLPARPDVLLAQAAEDSSWGESSGEVAAGDEPAAAGSSRVAPDKPRRTRLRWFQRGDDFVIEGQAPVGMAIRVNSHPAQPDAGGRFLFSAPLCGRAAREVVVAHSLAKEGIWEIAIHVPRPAAGDEEAVR
ncbi:MAG: DUF4912 domain-containing protein [Acidobacteria bacterium]|nr:DUF4912 domain-containing protein [Acidobacteriota bacterium]